MTSTFWRLKTTSIFLTDPDDDDDDDLNRGREWPLTLSPRIVRDKFAIDVNTVRPYQIPSLGNRIYSCLFLPALFWVDIFQKCSVDMTNNRHNKNGSTWPVFLWQKFWRYHFENPNRLKIHIRGSKWLIFYSNILWCSSSSYKKKFYVHEIKGFAIFSNFIASIVLFCVLAPKSSIWFQCNRM